MSGPQNPTDPLFKTQNPGRKSGSVTAQRPKRGKKLNTLSASAGNEADVTSGGSSELQQPTAQLMSAEQDA